MPENMKRLFGIIGNPVGHSLSPAMHNAALTALGVDGIYLPIQPENLEDEFRRLREDGFVGVSVTIPYKVAVMDLVDRLDPMARKIGAVNTLFFQDEPAGRRCTGYNTDWLGAERALAEVLDLAGARVLLIGAGGAARAVGFGLARAGAELFLSNRSEEKGKALAAQLNCPFVPLEQLSAVRAEALVNTTSVGMAPDTEAMPLPVELIPRFGVVMDIVYAPLETRLLREAARCGCRTVDGLRMLLYQGAAQFRLWTGLEAPVEVMRQSLLTALAARHS